MTFASFPEAAAGECWVVIASAKVIAVAEASWIGNRHCRVVIVSVKVLLSGNCLSVKVL